MKKLISILLFTFVFAIIIFPSITSATTAVKKNVIVPHTAPAAIPITEINTSTNKTVKSGLGSMEAFRINIYKNILATTDATQKQIDLYSSSNHSTATDGTRAPILYIKLFFLLVLGFIFGNQVLFYGLFALLVFIILRFIYRKIRNR